MRRRATITAFTILLATGCGADDRPEPEEQVGPAVGGTLVIVSTDNFDHANPLVTSMRYAQEMLRYALFLPLLRWDETLALAPALAEQWTVEGDTAVVFRLRRDVRWHDGEPTTAWDVAFTFERAANPATAFPNVDWIKGWGPPVVVDSFTIRFRIDHPDPLAMVPLLTIVPRHKLERVAPEQMRQAAFNRAPVGNGPFQFVAYIDNDRWEFEANLNFPESLGGRPYVDRLVWRIVPDGAAQAVELITGRAHLALGATVEQVVDAVSQADLRLIVRPSRQYGFVGWNGRRPPLGNAAVRRALTLALDRQTMVDALRAGYGELASGPIGAWNRGFDASIAPLPFAPDSARALLEAAGLRDRDGDGFRERADGSPLRLSLKVPANNTFNRNLGEMVINDLRNVGIRMELRPTEANTLIADVTSPAREFDAFIYGWEADFRLDLRGLFHSAEIRNPLQFAAYRNAAADSLIDRLATSRDTAQMHEATSRLQQILRDEQPWSFLYFYPDVYLASSRLRGADMDIRGALVNLSEWWLAGAAQSGPATK